MRPIIFTFIAFISINISFAQTPNPDYDPQLAQRLGADDYGMKNYVLAILKTGKVRIDNKDTLNVLFKGHMDNIQRLVKEGLLFVAGPFGQNALTYRGLFILNVKTKEEDLIPWYGSAALCEYIKVSEKIIKYIM